MLTNTPMGFHLEFANGWIISVQWGPQNYCSTRATNWQVGNSRLSPFDGKYHEFESNTAEVAVMHKEHTKMYPLSDHDDVKGWLNADEVAKYIYWVSRLDSDYHKVMANAPHKGLSEPDDYRMETIKTFKML